MRLVRVAVPIPKDEGYVYAFPDGEPPEPGLRVLVPLGRRRVWGTVLETVAEPPRGVTVRPIAGIHEPRIALTQEVLDLCRWIAGYYAASLGEVLGAAAPSVTALKSREARAFTRSFFEGLGYKVEPSETNFLMVNIRRDSKEFKDTCLTRGVMIGRQFPQFKQHSRISIGSMDEMQRATAIFREVLSTA